MELVAQTSAGPLQLELRQVGGATSVALGTGDSWNSAYTPVSLGSFLADFAGLPDDEAEALSARVLDDWAASPESAPPPKRAGRRRAAFAPAGAVLVATLLATGAIVYVLVRALLLAATG